MWPILAIIAAGGGYYLWSKKTAVAAPPAVSPYHAGIVNLPPAGTPNAGVYVPSSPPPGPVVQTSNGPSSPSQSPGPTAVNPPPPVVHHTFDPSMGMIAIPMAMQAPLTPPTPAYAPIDSSGNVVPAPLPAPMPSGYTNSKGEFITWSPYEAGVITHDPVTGPWLYSQGAKVSLTIYTPQGHITLPSSMIYNLDTAELRI